MSDETKFSLVFIPLLLIGGFAFLYFFCWLISQTDEWKLMQQPSFEHPAILTHKSYTPSVHVYSPNLSGKYANHRVFVSNEYYITEWDCGCYGNLVSHDEKIYRRARSKSVLMLQKYKDLVCICGIV